MTPIRRVIVVLAALAALAPLMRGVVASGLTGRAEMYLVYGRYHQAGRYMSRAVLIDPSNSNVMQPASLLWSFRMPSPKERAELDQYLAEHPDDADTLWSRALIRAREHDGVGALGDARRAYALSRNQQVGILANAIAKHMAKSERR